LNIVITGANRGLGYELTLAAAQRGHKVITGIRSPEPKGKFLELIGRFPDQIEPVQLDVCSEETITRLSEKLLAERQSVDAIINNAGILLGRGVTIEECRWSLSSSPSRLICLAL
jgi:NAD(P)-dependent dehydrogenase (short-subunit alcohol dehydrogenase family)